MSLFFTAYDFDLFGRINTGKKNPARCWGKGEEGSWNEAGHQKKV